MKMVRSYLLTLSPPGRLNRGEGAAPTVVPCFCSKYVDKDRYRGEKMVLFSLITVSPRADFVTARRRSHRISEAHNTMPIGLPKIPQLDSVPGIKLGGTANAVGGAPSRRFCHGKVTLPQNL